MSEHAQLTLKTLEIEDARFCDCCYKLSSAAILTFSNGSQYIWCPECCALLSSAFSGLMKISVLMSLVKKRPH